MIDLFPFSGLSVGVLGLDEAGLAAARSLALGGAEVFAWDDDEARRAAAGVPVRDLAGVDWRELVTLVIGHRLPHHGVQVHPLVAAARAGGCEVIGDAELLARAQRDAQYVAVVSRDQAGAALDLLGHVFQVSGKETEVGGDAARPLLGLAPLDAGGVYVLSMPPARADLTVSITFDCAIHLDLGEGPWPPFATREDAVAASRWVFHRQTAPRTAVVSIDHPDGRALLAVLRAEGGPVVIPISGRDAVPGGVYVRAGVLYDDRNSGRAALTELPVAEGGVEGLLAAAAYAGACAMKLDPHAAMACLRSYFAA